MNVEVAVYKTCTKCGQSKPYNKFYRHKYATDGLSPWCKDCRCIDTAAYYLSRGGKEKLKRRPSRVGFGASISNHACFATLKKVAGQRGLNVDMTLAQYTIIVSGPCNYCGMTITHGGGRLDRLDNSRGYDIRNVVPCCKICNQARSNIFSPEEMKIIGATIRRVLQARL